jgi:PAS domain S-box-containing protein
MLATIGYDIFYTQGIEQAEINKINNELLKIANLKATQVLAWRQGLLLAAEDVQHNGSLTSLIIKNGASDSVARFKTFQSIRNVFRLANAGDIEIAIVPARTLQPEPRQFTSKDRALVQQTITEGKIIFSEIFGADSDGSSEIGLAIPIGEGSTHHTSPAYILIVSIETENVLYPFLLAWPTTSYSSEIVLLRHEGNDVVYLTEFRKRHVTKSPLKYSINSDNLPAGIVAMGGKGTIAGMDYRNVPVFAAATEIPNSPWILVAKIDQEEILSVVRSKMYDAHLVSALIGALLVGTLLFFFNRNNYILYRRLYEDETSQHALKAHYEYLVKYANDIIILADQHYTILEVNDRACTVYGYKSSEMVGKNLSLLFSDSSTFLSDLQRDKSALVQGITTEAVHRTANNRTFPVELSIRSVKIDQRLFFQAIIRDITERNRFQDMLRYSEEKFQKAFEKAPFMIMLTNMADGTIIDMNEEGCSTLGVSRKEAIGKTTIELGIIVERERNDLIREIMDRRRISARETILHATDGHAITCSYSGEIIQIGTTPVLLSIAEDITDRKLSALEREIMLNVLHTINSSSNLHELLESMTRLMQAWSNCSAVGIRLRDGTDFPYWETRGFPAEFVQKENSLCMYDPNGNLCRDINGNPVLECLCGNIIGGKFDPEKPFFTKNGSFWTNSITQHLASIAEMDPQVHIRNSFINEGYESVALVPIHTGGSILGLMQYNDKEAGRFTPRLVELFERLADYIGLAIAEHHAHAAMKKSQEELKEYLEIIESMILVLDRNGNIDVLNRKGCELLGCTLVEAIGKNWFDTFIPERARTELKKRYDVSMRGEGMHLPYFEDAIQTKGGFERLIARHISLLKDENGTTIGSISACEDITERRQAELALYRSEERYRSIFDDTPIAIWEEDFSAVKNRLDELIKTHLGNLNTFLDEHPEDVAYLANARSRD